jgi:hypothetical protein
MRKALAATALALAACALPAASAQTAQAIDATDLQALRTVLQSEAEKRAYVASTLALSEAEAKKFWPIYDNYRLAVDGTNRRLTRALQDLAALERPMSEAYAKNVAAELVAIDDAEIRARRTLNSRVLRALPPKKAIRYLQLEAKFRSLRAYDLAGTFPLVR